MTKYEFDEYLEQLENINRINGLISDYDLIKSFKKYNKKIKQVGGKYTILLDHRANESKTLSINKLPMPKDTPVGSESGYKSKTSDINKPPIPKDTPPSPCL